MTTMTDTRSSAAAIWAGAIVSAFIGAAILYDAEIGINWPIWVAAASLGVILARRLAGLELDRPVLILLGWAILLAGSSAVTSAEPFHVLVIVSDAMLLGLAMVVTGTASWRSLSAKLLPLVPFLAPARVGLAALRETASAPKTVGSARAKPWVRGTLLTLPIVIVLVALLRNADPVFAMITDRLTAFLPEWSFSGRVIFFLFLLVLTLGANAVSARQADPRIPSLRPVAPKGILGITEQRMILYGVAIVLWLFVLLQGWYLIHPLPNAVGSGVTYAEYARQGFGQMTVAVTLVAGIVIVLEATRSPETGADTRTFFFRMESALIVALELILLSAFRRVMLYEDAYGFTTTRLFAQCYMVVIAIGVVALWLETRKGGISVDLGRRIAVVGLSVFTILAYWNHDAWIVDQNIATAQAPGKFDFDYAFKQLSPDAIPALVRHRNDFNASDRTILDARLACVRRPGPRRWYEANLRVKEASLALGAPSADACPKPVPAPRGPVDTAYVPAATPPPVAPLGRTSK